MCSRSFLRRVLRFFDGVFGFSEGQLAYSYAFCWRYGNLFFMEAGGAS